MPDKILKQFTVYCFGILSFSRRLYNQLRPLPVLPSRSLGIKGTAANCRTSCLKRRRHHVPVKDRGIQIYKAASNR
ncbi:hypothetical protein DI291_10010 [Bacillus paralicheniformis]|nr:hypothetical protein DI291_10010 [Bacillus paralicheniformis]